MDCLLMNDSYIKIEGAAVDGTLSPYVSIFNI